MKNENLKLRGTKLWLRYPKIEDAAEFIANAKSSRKFHRNLVSPPVDARSFADYTARNQNESDECLLICRSSDNAICGAVNLSQIFRKSFQNAYLGYYLFEKYTGGGLMTEAVQLTLRFAFKVLKLHRIEANVQPENAPSIAVLRRCGFTKEGFSPKYLKIGGHWRDHERWAIIREDWRNKNESGNR